MAPVFDANTDSIQSIIDGEDAYEDLDPLEVAAVEARRLILLLLANTHQSPFLYEIHHKPRGLVQSTKNEEQSSLYLSQLAKALHGMLVNQGQDTSMKMFLGMCLKTTPELVPHFFRLLQISDPRPTYRSLAALTFVEGVLREAPPPPHHVQGKLAPIEQMLPALIPPCVTKNLLGKVIQSQSALMVSSGLKLIITILRRVHDCISSFPNASDRNRSDSASNQLKHYLSQAVMRHLPELSLLFSIPSRFDPFEQPMSISSAPQSNALVILQLCEAIQKYAMLDSSLLENIKFDWTRLVPTAIQEQDQNRLFSNAEPIMQRRILQTLLVVSQLSQTLLLSQKMLPSVQSILISTKIPEVYTAARKLALLLMEEELFSGINHSNATYSVEADETQQCQEYESSLWIDGISADIIQELVSLIDESKQQRVQQKILLSQAWSKASMGYAMPAMGTSPLILFAIYKIFGDGASLSSNLSLILIQIATKLLLFMVDPSPLAAFIVFCSLESNLEGKDVASLYRVAKGILQDEPPDTYTLFATLVSEIFLPDSRLSYIVQMAKDTDHPQLDISCFADITSLRQCLSIMKYSGKQSEKLKDLVRSIVIKILEVRTNKIYHRMKLSCTLTH